MQCLIASKKKSFAVRALVPILSLSVGCGASGSSLKGYEFAGQVSEQDLHKAYVEMQKDTIGQRAVKSWHGATWDDLHKAVSRSADSAHAVAFNIGSATILSEGLTATSYKESLKGFAQFKNVDQLMAKYQVNAAAVTPEALQKGAMAFIATSRMSDVALNRLSKSELDQLVRNQLVLLEAIGTVEAMNNQPKLGFIWFLAPLFGAIIAAARLAPSAARAAAAGAKAAAQTATEAGGRVVANAAKAAADPLNHQVAAGATRIAADRVGNVYAKNPDQVAFDVVDKVNQNNSKADEKSTDNQPK